MPSADAKAKQRLLVEWWSLARARRELTPVTNEGS